MAYERQAHAAWLFSEVLVSREEELLLVKQNAAAASAEASTLRLELAAAAQEAAALSQALTQAEAELAPWTRLASTLEAQVEHEREARLSAEAEARRLRRVTHACAAAALVFAAAPASLVDDCAALRGALELVGAAAHPPRRQPRSSPPLLALRSLLSRRGYGGGECTSLCAGQRWRPPSGCSFIILSGLLAGVGSSPDGSLDLRAVITEEDDREVAADNCVSWVALRDSCCLLHHTLVDAASTSACATKDTACEEVTVALPCLRLLSESVGIQAAMDDCGALIQTSHAALLRCAYKRSPREMCDAVWESTEEALERLLG
jgi:hypothetical protein